MLILIHLLQCCKYNQSKCSFQLRARRLICFMQIRLLYSIQSSQSNSSQIFYLMCNVMLFLLMFNLPSLLDQLPIFEFSMIGSCKDHSSQNLKTKTQSKIFEKKGTKNSKPQGRIQHNFFCLLQICTKVVDLPST